MGGESGGGGGGGFGNERTQSERGEAAVGGLRAKLESV